MAWAMFVIGAIMLIGAGTMKNENWRQQLHCWFGAWTGITIMIIAMAWEYAQ